MRCVDLHAVEARPLRPFCGRCELRYIAGNLVRFEFARHFIQLSYAGRSQSAPKELSSAANVRKFNFNVPGAIGYVRASEVDDTVKVVRIDGNLPGDAAYRLKLASK